MDDLKPAATMLMKIAPSMKISILSPYKAGNYTVLIHQDTTPVSPSYIFGIKNCAFKVSSLIL